MLNFSDTTIHKIIVHHIGNPSLDEPLHCSKEEFPLQDSELEKILSRFFLHPFQKSDPGFFNFKHDSDLNLNEMYHYASRIFNPQENFQLQSVNIAKHLFEKSDHPKIKSGELYVVYLQNCLVDDEVTDGIGIFKSENKDLFLKVYATGEKYNIEYQDGINIHKLDKGCLIFNTEKDLGYKICILDKTNHDETRFWKDEFLKIAHRDDDFYHTKASMSMARNFCNTVLAEEEKLSTNKQLEVKDKVLQYFSENESFDHESFEKQVFEEPQVVDSYRDFRKQFAEQNDLITKDAFDIAEKAVKKEKKFFKSVIKLDKNFHIYVHSNPDMIEKGFDDAKGKFFYRLFFDEEK